MSEALATTRLLFGNEAIEYRLPTGTRVGAMLGIKEYPTPTVVGMFNRLLSAPFPLVLTQSFTFLSRAAAQGLLQRQFNRMANAGDFAVSQAEELKERARCADQQRVRDGRSSLLAAGARGSRCGRMPPRRRTARLRTARTSTWRAPAPLLADTGMTVAREDLALEAAFWAQLPGNFALRPRKAPITSRNFAAMVPFHNYPCGRARGNHWGEALALLVHERALAVLLLPARERSGGPDGGSRKDTGHTFICGPTGSGKTVFIGFLVAMLARQGVTQVLFDKDRGLEILVRALGGEYLPLRNGAPPASIRCSCPRRRSIWSSSKRWLRAPGAPRDAPGTAHARESADLDQALRGTLALELRARRLSRLIEFLDPTDPEGLHARLARWCECAGGDYAWVFDNREDSVVGRLAGHSVDRLRRHGVSRPRADPGAGHALSLPPGAAAARWPAARVLDGRVLAAARRPCIRESSPRMARRPGAS